MKTFTPSKRYLLVLLLPFFAFVFNVNTSSAQKVDRQVAIKEARANRAKAGFQKITFSKASLEKMLNDFSVIQIYNGAQRNSRETTLMIIGVSDSGEEVGEVFLQGSPSGNVVRLGKSVKDLQFENVRLNGRLMTINTKFRSADLLALLTAPGVTGLDFSPAMARDAEGNATLTIIVSPTGDDLEEESLQSFKSPCPPDCNF